MPVPDYETFMLPLLQLANDQQEHTLSSIVDQAYLLHEQYQDAAKLDARVNGSKESGMFIGV